MWRKLLVFISVYELSIIGLLQSETVPSSVVRVLEQFPIVGVVIFTLYYVQKQQREDNRETRKWLEHMLEVQHARLCEIYDSQGEFLATIIHQIEAKQDRMSEAIEMLSKQIMLNTATVNEIAKVDSIVSELIDKLGEK